MNLLKALARTSSMTMLSRILGFVRDAINAHQFGASKAMDAFVVAFMLPNMFRRIFAEGAFSQAFVPLLAEYKQKQGDSATRQFIADVAGVLTLALVVLTVIGVAAAPAIVFVSASGYEKDAHKFQLTVELTRITFPYILLISLSSLVGSILNTWNRFSVPAFTPTLLNLFMIGSSLLLAPYFNEPIFALAIGVTAGGLAQLVFQLPFLAKIGMLSWPRLNLHDPGVWRVIKQMGPAMFGVSVAPISLLLNRNFASYLPDHSMSWMYYADRLMELPTGVLGVALGTILLPSLAKLNASERYDDYSATLDWGLRLCWLLALPAAIAMAVIGEPLIAVLFERGQFGLQDTLMTQRALMAYAVGLMALVSIKVLAPAFYARQDIRTPVKIGIATLVMTQIFNLLLYEPLAHAGLALAISLAACLNAGLLYLGLRMRKIYQPQPGWLVFLGKLVIAVSLMAIALWGLQHALGAWHGMPGRVLVGKLSVLIGAGASVYFIVLAALGFRPRDFSRRST
ncbi:murein biosynthesis integral membrane protein MurJ [Chitinimonas sp. BJB300]|uniref:murein biosynthesis integral membrane protein MurJ n=1 Tax=Chitinimonas sp. BJB300 TaxID=1559339 RepID=UPI000C0DB79D|nr:murein biosynthesis integral membrane protein MurJ [Chitinimonas sp. BJB300]PHV10912.1 murein biosynthesis integral membrane protein MurJ [Chitinimonas sp. BJB300]TSJ89956.1 murein biosynthesis integral membrane protein MurJ [Chitinimonas sp. BJB300]